jgi:hypothetical protein
LDDLSEGSVVKGAVFRSKGVTQPFYKKRKDAAQALGGDKRVVGRRQVA